VCAIGIGVLLLVGALAGMACAWAGGDAEVDSERAAMERAGVATELCAGTSARIA
jgi:phage-related minor tail protein